MQTVVEHEVIRKWYFFDILLSTCFNKNEIPVQKCRKINEILRSLMWHIFVFMYMITTTMAVCEIEGKSRIGILLHSSVSRFIKFEGKFYTYKNMVPGIFFFFFFRCSELNLTLLHLKFDFYSRNLYI